MISKRAFFYLIIPSSIAAIVASYQGLNLSKSTTTIENTYYKIISKHTKQRYAHSIKSQML